MNKKHNKGRAVAKLIAAINGSLAIDVTLKLVALTEAVTKVAKGVDVTSITKQLTGLLI